MRLRTALLSVLVACSSGPLTEGPTAAKRVTESQAVFGAGRSTQTAPRAVSLPATQIASDAAAEAPWSLTASDGSGLVMTRLDAKAVVQGPLAFTELHLYFDNAEDRIREGTFAITLPPGAAVSRFAMENNGQWMEAEIVEKQLARRAYEDFLHRRQDPALMEKAPGNQFTARVFPIPARGTKHLVVSFSQTLPGERYALPLRGLPKVDRVDVELATMTLTGKRELENLSRRAWTPDRDFVSGAQVAVEALSAGTTVVAQVDPLAADKLASDTPTAMTILVDTSASRALGFERYASSLSQLVAELASRHAGLPIDVVAFDQDTETIYSGPAAGFGAAHLSALRSRGASGASDLGQALAAVKALRSRLVVITDGVLTAGAKEDAVLAAAKALAPRVERLDVVLAGGIRDDGFAMRLATAGLTRAGAVLDLDDGIADVASGLGERVAANVAVAVEGATWVYPKVIPSARAGQRHVIYARLAKPSATIDVTIGGHRRAVGLVGGTPALVERAASIASIEELEGNLATASGASRDELRKQIVQTSRATRVISSQTSMLVLESEGDYERYGIDRKSLADILVVGAAGIEQTRRSVQLAMPVPTPVAKPRPTKVDKLAKEGLKDAANKGVDGIDVGEGKTIATEEFAFEIQDKDAKAEEKPDDDGRGYLSMNGRAAGSAPAGDVAGLVAPEPPSAGSGARTSAAPTTTLDGHGDSSRRGRGVALAAERSVDRPLVRDPSPAPARVAVTTPRPRPADEGVAGAADAGSSREPWPPPGAAAPLHGPLAEIDGLIRRGNADAALAKAAAWRASAPGDVLALIAHGEALEAKRDVPRAARAYGSIIDLFPARADLRRFAGERLERLAATAGNARALAVDTYRRAVEERPDHLSGHRLLAYAELRAGNHGAAFTAILAGLDREYPADRFRGGKRILAEDAGLIAAAYIAASPAKRGEVMRELSARKLALPTAPSTRFIMYWETDANDVDFHITDARGGHAYYGKPQLASGGELYADVTTGYGPECFALPGGGKAGPYKLSINYYSQGPMGYGMGLLQILRHDGKGGLAFEDRPYVIMADHAYVDLGTFKP